MKDAMFFGLLTGGSAVVAFVVAAVYRARRTDVPVPAADEAAGGADGRGRPRATRTVFVVLAWVSPWVAVVGLLAGIPAWVEAANQPTPRTRAEADDERAAYRSGGRLGRVVATVGFGLGIAGCYGVRSGRGAAAILTGCVLGFVLNTVLSLVAISYYVYFGVERFKGPYV